MYHSSHCTYPAAHDVPEHWMRSVSLNGVGVSMWQGDFVILIQDGWPKNNRRHNNSLFVFAVDTPTLTLQPASWVCHSAEWSTHCREHSTKERGGAPSIATHCEYARLYPQTLTSDTTLSKPLILFLVAYMPTGQDSTSARRSWTNFVSWSGSLQMGPPS